MKRTDQAHSYGLTLADNTPCTITALDREAQKIADQFAGIMTMGPRSTIEPGLNIIIGKGRIQCVDASQSRDGARRLRVSVRPHTFPDMTTINSVMLSMLIARDVQQRGGVLLHGALAELSTQGGGHDSPDPSRFPNAIRQGVILAGPSSTGKTTLSQRLPPPWRSLSDDATLVVRDQSGSYWAHPWPTWSRFSEGVVPGKEGGAWPVESAVLLRGVFFLRQSDRDCATPLNLSQFATSLMESTQQVTRLMIRRFCSGQEHEIYAEQVRAVTALAAALPGYSLDNTLYGEFWKSLRQALRDSETGGDRRFSAEHDRQGTSTWSDGPINNRRPLLMRRAGQKWSVAPPFLRVLRGDKPTLVMFQDGKLSPVFKLILAGKEVGCYSHEETAWHIRWPYRIFVSPNDLGFAQK